MPNDPHPLLAPPLEWSPAAASRAALSDGVIDIWRIDLASSARDTAAAASILSNEELARAERYRFERHRARFIMGRAALREIIAGYCGLEARALQFAVEPAGRPTLAHETCVAFSYSKTNDMAVVAVTGAGRVGVDIEPVVQRPDLDMVVSDQFSPVERDQISQLPDEQRLEAFYRGWTGREVLVKATGEGLTAALPLIALDIAPDRPARLIAGPPPYDPSVWRLKSFSVGDRTLGAVALDRPIRSIRAIVR